uniref:Hispidin-3-hydroxylase n=1 Tax=Neonothopanus nambi TaxID=71958 RepID=H3H_NEONM
MASFENSLSVLIVGAGLGGLAAAIALRRQGHVVKIYDSSSFKAELGAGLAVPPNTLRSLQQLGCNTENLNGVDNLCFTAMGYDGSVGMMNNMTDYREAYGTSWIMVHRVDLHNELMRVALDPGGLGPPATLHLNHRVTFCDVDACTVTFTNGTTQSADLIVGADGIRSTIRRFVLEEDVTVPASGIVGFRWLVQADALDPYPELDWIVKKPPLGARLISTPQNPQSGVGLADRRTIIIYACRGGTMVNVLAVHDDERDQNTADWSVPASKDDLFRVFHDYHPRFRRLLELAQDINLWQMRVVPVLKKWVNKRVCLLGDAAHASLPTLGQGFGMGLEDAVALGTLLPKGTTASQIETRLAVYEQLRKDRAEFVAAESYEEQYVPEMRGLYLRSKELRDRVMGYDIKVESEKVLETLLRSSNSA